MTRTPLRRAWIALILALGLALTACGGSGDSGDSDAWESKDGSSAEPLTKDDFAKRVADAQMEAETAHMTMKTEANGQKMTAEGDIQVGESVDDTKLTMAIEAADQKMDMRLIDKVMYMNMGQMSDDKFVKIDLTDESNPIGKQFSGMADQVDPSQQIEDMGDAVTNFEKKGSPEDIDGVKAQRYDVTIDPSEMSSVPEDTQSMLPDKITYTMYVDADDLMHRITMDMQGTEMTMDYSKWGESVDIDKPSDSEVTDKMPGMQQPQG